jgi:hypothetical protein
MIQKHDTDVIVYPTILESDYSLLARCSCLYNAAAYDGSTALAYANAHHMLHTGQPLTSDELASSEKAIGQAEAFKRQKDKDAEAAKQAAETAAKTEKATAAAPTGPVEHQSETSPSHKKKLA